MLVTGTSSDQLRMLKKKKHFTSETPKNETHAATCVHTTYNHTVLTYIHTYVDAIDDWYCT